MSALACVLSNRALQPARGRAGLRSGLAALLATAAGLIPAGAALAANPAAPAETPLPDLNPVVRSALESISGREIVRQAAMLCDPKMAGRQAGESGARRAADYVAKQFRAIGLSPGGQAGGYFQTFKIRAGYQLKSELSHDEAGQPKPFKRQKDYMPVHIPQDRAEIRAGYALAGYGLAAPALEFDEYAGLDVKGRAVIVFSGVPWGQQTAAWLWRLEKGLRDSLVYKAKTAAARGAAMLLIVDDPAGWRKRLGYTEQLRLPDPSFPVDSPIPVVQISRRAAASLLGMSQADLHQHALRIQQSRRPQSFVVPEKVLSYTATISGRARIGRNVIGVLPGSDPVLRRQAIVLGAHYDHLGEGQEGTYFGANDNAGSVGALLEIARAMRRLPEPPKRTLIFIAFAAEEIGQLGSNYYVAHPSLPLERIALMLNFDMIGRNEPDEINVVASRSSDELHRLHQQANGHVGLTLHHPDNLRLGRADHTAFYLARVPVAYFFGGLHAGYHTPDDTVDKLIPGKLEKVARLAFLTSLFTAQLEQPLKFTGEMAAEWK